MTMLYDVKEGETLLATFDTRNTALEYIAKMLTSNLQSTVCQYIVQVKKHWLDTSGDNLENEIFGIHTMLQRHYTLVYRKKDYLTYNELEYGKFYKCKQGSHYICKFKDKIPPYTASNKCLVFIGSELAAYNENEHHWHSAKFDVEPVHIGIQPV